MKCEGSESATSESVLEAIDSLLDASGAPRSLRSLGVAREDLPELATRALNDACILTSPRQATKRDLLSILERAY